MIRIKPQTKRKVAGVLAFILALAMLLTSVPVLFMGNTAQEGQIQTEEVTTNENA
ncbi:MAG: hypothetical protein ACI4VF_04730 [Lachnospirales bacterium]